MKQHKIISLILVFVLTMGLLFISSCKKTNIETGLKGTIKYGRGDCMPVIDESSRKYYDYTGVIYFIKKADLDSLGIINFELLKQISIEYKVRDGELSVELPPNTYVLMPEDVYLYSAENTITIKFGEVRNQDFRFWYCTTE